MNHPGSKNIYFLLRPHNSQCMGGVFPLKNRQRENLKSGPNSQMRRKGGSPFGNKRKMSLNVVLTILFLLFFPANPSFSFLQFLSAHVCLSASFTCFPSTINCFLLTPLCIALHCNAMCALLNPSVSFSLSLHHLYSVASGGPFTNLGIIRKHSTIISH